MRMVIWVGAIVATLGVASSARGDELNGPPTAGWDFSDPVNIAESRLWAALYWEWRDSGVLTPEFSGFQFTNPVPSDLTPIDYAYAIFEQLYATELAALSTPEAPYSVIQLILDDPDVMQQFRVYTTTGLLSTNFAQNQDATWSHLDMATLAAGGDGYSMESAWTEDGSVLTQSLLVSPGPGALPPLTPPFENPEVPEELGPFDEALRDLVNESPLRSIPYESDHPPTPGYDCDHYAISMAAWLRRLQQQYPDMQIGLLLFLYDKDDGRTGGHAVTIVRIGGYYYIIDTQSNSIKGPYPAPLWPMYPIRELMCEQPGYGSQCNTQNIEWREISPYYWIPGRWIPGEAPPWYADPTQRQEICDLLEVEDAKDGIDDYSCEDFIWNVGGA